MSDKLWASGLAPNLTQLFQPACCVLHCARWPLQPCAHEDHADTLKEAVAHDKCEPDDRWVGDRAGRLRGSCGASALVSDSSMRTPSVRAACWLLVCRRSTAKFVDPPHKE